MAAMELLDNDPAAGLEELQELAELYPADSRVLYGLGVAYVLHKDYHAALEPLEKAVKREQVHAEAMNFTLSGVYNSLGMFAHAYQARLKSGEPVGSWQEIAEPEHPAEESIKDMLEFESARYELMYRRNNISVALRRLKALCERYPDYVPARNVLSTALYLDGELGQAEAQANAVLEQAPNNPQALLNLARIWRLTRGKAAVSELLARLGGELDPDTADHHLIHANVLALLDDAEGTRAALERFDEVSGGPPAAPIGHLRDALEKANGSDGPLLGLNQLLPSGLMGRWQRGGSKRVRSELSLLPGLFEGLPERLAYEPTKAAQAMSGLLLSKEIYVGGETLHGLNRSEWTQRFLDILSRPNVGTEAGRMGILQALQQLDLVPRDFKAVTREGHELQTYNLQLHSENTLAFMSKADQKLMRRAVELAHREQYQQALDIYRELTGRYPDNPRPRYNLAGLQQALAEQSGDRQAQQEVEQEFERIAQEYPDYLFGRGTVAVLAIRRGDLERATELLRLPDEVQGQPMHIDEYAYFVAAQALLSLERGQEKSVSSALLMIMETAGPDGSAMRMFINGLREHRKRRGESTDTDDLFDQIGAWLEQADDA